MNYEEKYKSALKWMQSLYGGLHGATKEEAEKYFPELKEPNDERIRKALIEYFGEQCDMSDWNGVYGYQALAWIEKQGEQTHAEHGQPEVTKTSDQELEPKFHPGDWIACKELNTAKIINIDGDRYEVEFIDGNKGFPHIEYIDRNFHFWTIADAKDGDILASIDDNEILIFRNLDTSTSFSSYYNITGRGDFGWFNMCFIPATKEQRDLLFQKMVDAGYEWDAEKKELKKIESNTLDPDKAIKWLKTNVFDDSAYGKAMIDKFKKDFGL